jgi:quercetin dioxygenase-like cupin family protein
MQIFDLPRMGAFPHDQREKNVFYHAPGFKARIIELEPGGGMPVCQMAHIVLFLVLRGQVTVAVDSDSAVLTEGQCLVTDPATISMHSEEGARLIGIEIAPKTEETC